MDTNNDSGDERDDSNSDAESAKSRSQGKSQSRGIDIGLAVRPVANLLKGIVSVGISHPSEAPRSKPGEPKPRKESAVDRRRSETVSTDQTASEYLVETYRYEDEIVIVADLPGVDNDDLSVGLAERSNAIVISVGGKVVSRVSLPWDVVEVDDVWFYNNVLNVRVRPVGGDASEL